MASLQVGLRLELALTFAISTPKIAIERISAPKSQRICRKPAKSLAPRVTFKRRQRLPIGIAIAIVVLANTILLGQFLELSKRLLLLFCVRRSCYVCNFAYAHQTRHMNPVNVRPKLTCHLFANGLIWAKSQDVSNRQIIRLMIEQLVSCILVSYTLLINWRNLPELGPSRLFAGKIDGAKSRSIRRLSRISGTAFAWCDVMRLQCNYNAPNCSKLLACNSNPKPETHNETHNMLYYACVSL